MHLVGYSCEIPSKDYKLFGHFNMQTIFFGYLYSYNGFYGKTTLESCMLLPAWNEDSQHSMNRQELVTSLTYFRNKMHILIQQLVSTWQRTIWYKLAEWRLIDSNKKLDLKLKTKVKSTMLMKYFKLADTCKIKMFAVLCT